MNLGVSMVPSGEVLIPVAQPHGALVVRHGALGGCRDRDDSVIASADNGRTRACLMKDAPKLRGDSS